MSVRYDCHYDCAKVYPGTVGTIDGTCAADQSLKLTSGGCSPDVDASVDAAIDGTSPSDAATDASHDASNDG